MSDLLESKLTAEQRAECERNDIALAQAMFPTLESHPLLFSDEDTPRARRRMFTWCRTCESIAHRAGCPEARQ